MPQWVLLVGVLIVLASLVLMVRRRELAGLLERVLGSAWRYAAALLRLLLGAVLLASADTVAFPAAVALFGWLFVLAGLGLVVIPDPPLRALVSWFGALPAAVLLLWLVAALAFGLFFIYAALAVV